MQGPRNLKPMTTRPDAPEAADLIRADAPTRVGSPLETLSHASMAAIALGSRVIGCQIIFAREGERFPAVVTNGRRFVCFVDDTAITDVTGRKIGTLRIIALGDRPALNAAERAIIAEVASILTAEHEAGLAVTHYDDETLLPNRLAFLSEIETLPPFSGTERHLLGFFSVTGLPHHIEILHALGQGFSEGVIHAAVRRLQQLLGPGVRIYKVNTLSFTFLCPTGEALVPSVFGKILEAFRHPVVYRDIPILMDAAIGYSELTSPAFAEDALRAAQIASRVAREAKGRVAFRATPATSTDHRGQTLLIGLKQALATGNQLHLAYQPRIDLASGRVVAVEAQIRWDHPELGRIPQAEFAPLAAASALATSLTRWQLETAFQEMARWLRRGLDLGLSVTIPAAGLRRNDFAAQLTELARACNIPPHLVEVEVKETAAVRAESAIFEQLNRCHHAGFKVAIDDFGTGFGKMRSLLKLPASVLKIDRSLIAELIHEPRIGVLVRSTIELARNLGYTSVATGVESDTAHHMLKSWGCDAGEGRYFAEPMPVDALVRWIEDHQ